MDVLEVDGFWQPRQLPAPVAGAALALLEQGLREPTVEVLGAAVARGLPFREEHRTGAEAPAEPNHPRRRPRRRPRAGPFAGVVRRHLFRQTPLLPARAEEPQDLVPAAGTGPAQAGGAIEGVLAHPEGGAATAAREVDGADATDFGEVVGGPGRWPRVLLTGPPRRPAHAWCGQAVALGHALDRPRVGAWAEAPGLEFGPEGRRPPQAVTGGRCGVGREPTADAPDRLLQLGREALADRACSGPVVQALGAERAVAAPPRVKPRLGAAQGGTARRDRAAGAAASKGPWACREFVVPGNLRGAAAGGCPRRSR